MEKSSTTPTDDLEWSSLEEWKDWREEKDRHLYAKYGKPLEKKHTGEFVAIGSDGQTILGDSTTDVMPKAVKKFGGGKFALARIGHDALGEWL